jgi:hypothetical protein
MRLLRSETSESSGKGYRQSSVFLRGGTARRVTTTGRDGSHRALQQIGTLLPKPQVQHNQSFLPESVLSLPGRRMSPYGLQLRIKFILLPDSEVKYTYPRCTNAREDRLPFGTAKETKLNSL